MPIAVHAATRDAMPALLGFRGCKPDRWSLPTVTKVVPHLECEHASRFLFRSQARNVPPFLLEGSCMKISIIILAHNEEECIKSTVLHLYDVLSAEQIDHEVLVINDNSNDSTELILQQLQATIPSLRYVNNTPP